MTLRPIAVLLALALLPALAAPVRAGAEAYAPLAVVAQAAWDLAAVAWAPGTEAADHYRVYGLDGASLVFLNATSGLTTMVEGGFGAYAVSGVKTGVESQAVTACVEVDPTRPAVVLSSPCDVLSNGMLPPVKLQEH